MGSKSEFTLESLADESVVFGVKAFFATPAFVGASATNESAQRLDWMESTSARRSIQIPIFQLGAEVNAPRASHKEITT